MSTTSYLKSFQEEHIIVIAVLIIISICTGSIITTIRHHAGSLLLSVPCRRPKYHLWRFSAYRSAMASGAASSRGAAQPATAFIDFDLGSRSTETLPTIVEPMWALWPPDKATAQPCGKKCRETTRSWPCRQPCSFRKNHVCPCRCAYHRFEPVNQEEKKVRGGSALGHRPRVEAGRSRSTGEAAEGKCSCEQQQQWQVLVSLHV